MGLAFTSIADVKNQPQKFGQMNARIVDVDFDNSYPTGGEAITEADIGFTVIYGAVLIGMSDGAGDGSVTSIILDVETAATPKLVCYDGGSEVANAFDLSGITARMMFFGR